MDSFILNGSTVEQFNVLTNGWFSIVIAESWYYWRCKNAFVLMTMQPLSLPGPAPSEDGLARRQSALGQPCVVLVGQSSEINSHGNFPNFFML
ncbi:hypothetical protein BN2497_12513 [Janthinobacterium sp. CG23_2]|nr:hypothetical protein BN2497_12513 [Janthinobacterium sp. CG23_2]CUU32654.1 hypothetical protein BN3177_12513 [Janthinobacterium sp. CG23_2]